MFSTCWVVLVLICVGCHDPQATRTKYEHGRIADTTTYPGLGVSEGRVVTVAGYDITGYDTLLIEDWGYEVPADSLALYKVIASACDLKTLMTLTQPDLSNLLSQASELGQDSILLLDFAIHCPGALHLFNHFEDLGLDVGPLVRNDSSITFSAVGSGQPRLVEFFMEKGAPINRETSWYGCYPIHAVEDVATLTLLLEAGADITKTCDGGGTLLHEIMKTANPGPVARYLVDRQLLDPNQKNKEGFTPISLAGISGHHDLSDYLYDCCYRDE